MLLYLSTNTRPDIAFAVSQVCRFNKDPRVSHAKAVKMIVRYLKRTSEMGTIIRFTNELNLVCFADADFAGLFGREEPRSDDAARSRGAYIISIGGILVTWRSWLMPAKCLGTLEAEYQCLSAAMVQMIALKTLLAEVCDVLELPALRSTISGTVWEDNQGAVYLATNQRITNRTKYFLVKWHHFWDHVSQNNGKDGKFEIKKVGTHDQRADYLTKGLPRETYEHIRELNQGW